MRQTFTELQNTTKDYISQTAGSVASSTIAAFIKEHLNAKYHLVQRKLDGWMVQDLPQTAVTVADQQRYHYPPSVYPPIESATLEINNVDYPLDIVASRRRWDELNQICFSGTTIPQYIFPMRDHFEVWPTPAASGDTITLVCDILGKDMIAEDYTTGTVSVTSNSTTITGSGTTFTASMVGRWFKTDNDPTFYRIASFTDTTHVELETVFEGTTASGESYTIGESPEIPPELHEILPHGAASDFFSGPRKDFKAAQAHLNYFFTGDYYNQSRRLSDAVGGLLNAIKKYASKDNSKIVKMYRNSYRNRFDERGSVILS